MAVRFQGGGTVRQGEGPVAPPTDPTVNIPIVTPEADDEGSSTSDGVIGGFDNYFLANRPIRYSGSTGGSTSPVSQFLYFDGDEWNLFQGRSPEYIASIQRQFVTMGWLDPSEVINGTWREAEADLMKQLMDTGNATNNAWSTVFGQYQRTAPPPSGGGRRGGGGGGAKAPTIRLSNPDDLRKAFRETARSITGGVFVDDAQIDGMVKAFQGQEASFQRKAIAGGTVTDPPSAQTFAEGEIEESDPGAVKGKRFADMASILEQIVGA